MFVAPQPAGHVRAAEAVRALKEGQGVEERLHGQLVAGLDLGCREHIKERALFGLGVVAAQALGVSGATAAHEQGHRPGAPGAARGLPHIGQALIVEHGALKAREPAVEQGGGDGVGVVALSGLVVEGLDAGGGGRPGGQPGLKAGLGLVEAVGIGLVEGREAGLSAALLGGGGGGGGAGGVDGREQVRGELDAQRGLALALQRGGALDGDLPGGDLLGEAPGDDLGAIALHPRPADVPGLVEQIAVKRDARGVVVRRHHKTRGGAQGSGHLIKGHDAGGGIALDHLPAVELDREPAVGRAVEELAGVGAVLPAAIGPAGELIAAGHGLIRRVQHVAVDIGGDDVLGVGDEASGGLGQLRDVSGVAHGVERRQGVAAV